MHFHYNFLVICNINLIFKTIFLKKKVKYITNPIHLDSRIYTRIAKNMYENDRNLCDIFDL